MQEGKNIKKTHVYGMRTHIHIQNHELLKKIKDSKPIPTKIVKLLQRPNNREFFCKNIL